MDTYEKVKSVYNAPQKDLGNGIKIVDHMSLLRPSYEKILPLPDMLIEQAAGNILLVPKRIVLPKIVEAIRELDNMTYEEMAARAGCSPAYSPHLYEKVSSRLLKLESIITSNYELSPGLFREVGNSRLFALGIMARKTPQEKKSAAKRLSDFLVGGLSIYPVCPGDTIRELGGKSENGFYSCAIKDLLSGTRAPLVLVIEDTYETATTFRAVIDSCGATYTGVTRMLLELGNTFDGVYIIKVGPGNKDVEVFSPTKSYNFCYSFVRGLSPKNGDTSKWKTLTMPPSFDSVLVVLNKLLKDIGASYVNYSFSSIAPTKDQLLSMLFIAEEMKSPSWFSFMSKYSEFGQVINKYSGIYNGLGFVLGTKHSPWWRSNLYDFLSFKSVAHRIPRDKVVIGHAVKSLGDNIEEVNSRIGSKFIFVHRKYITGGEPSDMVKRRRLHVSYGNMGIGFVTDPSIGDSHDLWVEVLPGDNVKSVTFGRLDFISMKEDPRVMLLA